MQKMLFINILMLFVGLYKSCNQLIQLCPTGAVAKIEKKHKLDEVGEIKHNLIGVFFLSNIYAKISKIGSCVLTL